MSRLDDVAESVMLEVDGALGCAVADMRSGALLGVAHNVPYFTQEYLEAVAAAAVEMFRGQTVRHTIPFMMVLPNHPEVAVALITNRETSLGVGWSATRRSVLRIEPILNGVTE